MEGKVIGGYIWRATTAVFWVQLLSTRQHIGHSVEDLGVDLS